MTVLRFTTTRLSGLQAAGRAQDMQHSVIAPLLERELGADFGRLFADFEMESADVRAWYVDSEVRPIRIDALPALRQQELRQKLATKIDRVLDLARVLERETAQRAHLARVLVAATTFPEEDIWVLDDEPLLVNWGFHHRDVAVGAPVAVRQLIKAQRTDAEAHEQIVQITVPHHEVAEDASVQKREDPVRRQWKIDWLDINVTPYLWVLFALLVVGCSWELLPSCTDIPILSSLKTCHSLEAVRRLDDVLQKKLTAERTRLQAPCPNPVAAQQKVQASPAAKEVEAAIGRIPGARSSEQRDIMVFWEGPAEVGLEIACPGPETAVTVNQTACGGTIRTESNAQGQTDAAAPFDTASWSAPRSGPFSILVVLRSFNGASTDQPVSFVMLMRNGFNVVHYASGKLVKVGSTALIRENGF